MSAPTTVRGVGVHSGAPAAVRLWREDDGAPVRFRRGPVAIEARVANVVATPQCTVLGSGGARVAMVEHLLAALRAAGFWRGVVVDVEGEEIPILDGSAAPWGAPIAELGPPPPPPASLVLAAPVAVRARGGEARATPGPARLDVAIRFDHPAVGAQRWTGDPGRAAELLDARTFGFLAQVEELRAAGRARGASLENAIVFDGSGPLRPLRHPDEPVRHKALDALGDLFLLGRPLAAAVTIERGSHELHVALARALERSPTPCAPGASDVPAVDPDRPAPDGDPSA